MDRKSAALALARAVANVMRGDVLLLRQKERIAAAELAGRDTARFKGPIRDIQVLCPMNRGGVGARSLNIELQAALNPAGERKVERFGWTFAPGDKVMQIENDYDKEV
jgi:ATP-dependent exoDNAse (exonuclease V) alpha subunit